MVPAVALLLGAPAVARASQILGDRDALNPTIAVNAQGVALVNYRTTAGVRRHVLAWGAVNAAPNPSTGAPAQQAFKLDYSGGWKSRHDAHYWRTFRNACRPYDGPPLPFFVAGCRAPDGSYWALQSWQRDLPMRGFAPWTAAQRAYELHLSHWSGPLPMLDVAMAWTYQGSQQGLFGRLAYEGQPVYGVHTSSARVVDPWARNVSIDTFDSSYGSGWRHVTQIATHRGDGAFCYTFVPQPSPAGYPADGPGGNGLGSQIRVLAMGPGVMPIVQWVGRRLQGGFSSAANASARAHFDAVMGRDTHCAAERPS